MIAATNIQESMEQMSMNFMTDIHSALHQFSLPSDERQVWLTEVVQFDDPRAQDPRMAAVIEEEVRDLLRRGTFKVILREEILDGANEFTGGYV